MFWLIVRVQEAPPDVLAFTLGYCPLRTGDLADLVRYLRTLRGVTP